MKKQTENLEILKAILTRLQALDPPVKKIAVQPLDPTMTMMFLDLLEVCYITTRTDSSRKETMFVTIRGEQFYNNTPLKDLEEALAEHPHFMRSSKSYIINLTKVRGFRFSAARDLWFEGLAGPVVNAVTATYLGQFESNFR